MSSAIEIASSRSALAFSCADLIAAELRAGIAANGRASFCATGGTTPAECYRQLAQEDLDWGKVTITLTDERWVDTKSDWSNERMVRQTLLTGNAMRANFLPLKARRGGVDDGARAAEKVIRPHVPFDVTLLGMGEDGHFASLFPGNPALEQGLDPVTDRWCVGVPPSAPAPELPRVSLTLRTLLASKLIILLITGQTKWDIAAEPGALPIAQLLSRAPVRILWAA
jgi:6-phosphogluconolactonase